MTQKSTVYSTRQFNQLIQQLTKNYTIKVQEVLLPPDNIAQHNEINITTSKDVNFQGIPQNIQLRFKNEGYVNNWNSCLTFNIPIQVDLSQIKSLQVRKQSQVGSTDILCDWVILDNFLCLKISVSNTVSLQLYNKVSQYIRILQIPPSPAAWLDNTILQKNNKENTPMNSYYWDIYRKQAVNNQLIDNDFTQYKQDQYAMVNQGDSIISCKIENLFNRVNYGSEAIWSQAQTENKEITLSSQMVDLTTSPVIQYIHQVEIPLAYFHPFFQMSGSCPLELLNDELLLTFNFNRHIFSALYSFDRYTPFKGESNTFDYIPDLIYLDSTNTIHEIYDLLKVKFCGIDNIKMNIYKDRVLKSRKLEVDKFGKFYITYRNSDKVQQRDFPKNGSPILQNVIPKLNSLDIIQMSVYDNNIYNINSYYQGLDYYIGYSSLFSSSKYFSTDGYFVQLLQNTGGQTQNIKYKLQNAYFQEYASGYTLTQDLPYITFGNVQIQIDDNNIIPYQYQSLQNIYQNNLSMYDINDNKQGINNQWQYGNWTKYFNTYFFKFDQSYGNQDELRSSTFQGLKTQGGNSNIYFELYNYNQEYPSKINYQSGLGYIYNNWMKENAFIEFIYYYTSLMMISNGDLIQVNEDVAEQIINSHRMKAKDDEDLKLIDARIAMQLAQMNKKNEEQAQKDMEKKEDQQIEQETKKEMPPL